MPQANSTSTSASPVSSGTLSSAQIAQIRQAAGAAPLNAAGTPGNSSLSDTLFGGSTNTDATAAAENSPSLEETLFPTNGNEGSPTQQPGLLERIGSDFNKRVNSAADAQLAADQGKESGVEATVHTIGQGGGMVSDIAGETAKSAIDSLPNAPAENAALANDPIVKLGAQALKIGGDLWDSFTQAHPKAADYVSSLANIGSILPIGAGVSAAGEGAEDVAKAAAAKAAETAAAAKEGVGKAATDAAVAATAGNRLPTLEEAAQKSIPVPGETALKDPLARYNEHVATEQTAVKDAKADTALGKVGSSIGDAFKAVVKQRQNAGKTMASELAKNADKPIDTGGALRNFQQQLLDNGATYDTVDKSVSTGKASKFSTADTKILQKYATDLQSLGRTPTAKELDAFISRIPNDIKEIKAKDGINFPTNAERIISTNLNGLRTSLTSGSSDAYNAARAKYANLSKFVNEGSKYLGKITQSGDFAKDASLAKSSVQSMLNNGKKDWLIKLENLTGYPAIHDATLALQAMKDVGDYRGASMLESLTEGAMKGELPNIPTSATGMVNHAVGKGIKKIAGKAIGTPVEQTQRFLKSLRK